MEGYAGAASVSVAEQSTKRWTASDIDTPSARSDLPSSRCTLLVSSWPCLQRYTGTVVAAHGWLWSASIRNSGCPPLNVAPARLAWPLLMTFEPHSIARIVLASLLHTSTKPNLQQ